MDVKVLHSIRESTCQSCNFLALLQFRVSSGDHILTEHLENAAGNTLYTIKTIQYVPIFVFFSVIADEATDVANDEQ